MRGALFAIVLLLPLQASADWLIRRETDLITDEELVRLAVTNADGHGFIVYLQDGGIRGRFRYGGKSTLADEPAIIFRVDKHKAFEYLEGLRVAGKYSNDAGDFYFVQANRADFTLHGGKEAAAGPILVYPSETEPSVGLAQLLTGKRLVVRYHLIDGIIEDTIFELGGEPEELAGALGLEWRSSWGPGERPGIASEDAVLEGVSLHDGLGGATLINHSGSEYRLEGVYATGVDPGSPADARGLRVGDLIVNCNRKRAKSIEDLKAVCADKALLIIGIRRGKKDMLLQIR